VRSPWEIRDVAASSFRTGRSTHADTGHATATSAINGSSPIPASWAQRTRMRSRVFDRSEIVTTTPTTSLSRPTGSATTSAESSHGGHFPDGSDLVPARAAATIRGSAGSERAARWYAPAGSSSTVPDVSITAIGMPYSAWYRASSWASASVRPVDSAVSASDANRPTSLSRSTYVSCISRSATVTPSGTPSAAANSTASGTRTTSRRRCTASQPISSGWSARSR
jgi:hypothetical protein